MITHLFELNATGEVTYLQVLKDLCELNAVGKMTYTQWSATNRSTLKIITHSLEEFLDIFFENWKFCYIIHSQQHYS
jgi:hypothetical protein